MKADDEYRGREQSGLKHRILHDYLSSWAQKLGSAADRLWYVDCFAGPWGTESEDFHDTSVAIGLDSLRAASAAHRIPISAVFVEKDPKAFKRLKAWLGTSGTTADCHVLQGSFGDHCGAIDALIGRDPAFILVDPCGWKGADMSLIATLGGKRRRDLLINFMHNFINRAKGMMGHHEWLREQMLDFFGPAAIDVNSATTEDELIGIYKAELKRRAGLRFVADCAILNPKLDRTWFRLVVAGQHEKVVELFREVEAKVCGIDAAEVRSKAKESGSSQMSLGLGGQTHEGHYVRVNRLARELARRGLLAAVDGGKKPRWSDVWPEIIEAQHLTLRNLHEVVAEMEAAGALTLAGRPSGKRVPTPDTTLAAGSSRSGSKIR